MGVGRPPPTGMACLCRPLSASGVAYDGRPSLRPGTTPRPSSAREARAPARRTPRHAAPRDAAAPAPTLVVVSRRTGAHVSLPAAPTVDARPTSLVVAPLVQRAVHVPVDPPRTRHQPQQAHQSQARHQPEQAHQYRPMSAQRSRGDGAGGQEDDAWRGGLNLDRLGGGSMGEGDAFYSEA